MDFLLNRHTIDYWWKKKFKILFGLFFLPLLKEPYIKDYRIPLKRLCIYGLRARFPNRLWNISQSSKMHATHSNASDWQICKNKQEFSDFWAISYCFVHIVMLIIIEMHFVLLTTISLLFVCEGHFWINFKKGRGLFSRLLGYRMWGSCRWRLIYSLFSQQLE